LAISPGSLSRSQFNQLSVDQLQQPAFPDFLRESLARAGLLGDWFSWQEPDEVPEPFRGLLVHEVDMTSTLERHHGEQLILEVLADGQADGYYFREVILRGAETGRAAEFGLIEIEVSQFPGDLHEAILSGRKPLGGIMNESGMTYESRPLGYFSVARGKLPTKLSALGNDEMFYGRYNQLMRPDGSCLARILEIIPRSSDS
jgi:hypothetical protein